MSTTRSGPLSGVRVVDMTRVVMGPFATQILADQGADVIMIEAEGGDTNRVMGPGPSKEFSGVSLNLLRNKRSVSADLKDESPREWLRSLTAGADVFVTTLLPDSLTRLGLDYEAVRQVNPEIVYCQAQGWPLGSELENAPAYDDIIQSASGVGDAVARVDGEPGLMPTILADKVCGIAIAQAVTAALFARSRDGKGQHVEVPMVQAMAAFMLVEHGAGAIPEPAVQQHDLPATGYPRILTPERRPQRTLDGYIQILPYSPKHFVRILSDAGETDVLKDPRFTDIGSAIKHADELYRLMRPIIAKRTTAEWLAYCREASIPAVEMVTLQGMVDKLDLAAHPSVGDYRTLPVTANFSRTPTDLAYPAPGIGEHSDQLLNAANPWEVQ